MDNYKAAAYNVTIGKAGKKRLSVHNDIKHIPVIPACLKKSTIIPVLKKPRPSCLNDYHLVALTSMLIKCFERLIKDYICSSLLSPLDPLQFAYCPKWSTEDTVAHTLHTTLSHLDKRGSYVRLLFTDYSSEFNTMVSSRLVTKLKYLGHLAVQVVPSLPDGQIPGSENGQT